MKSTLRQRHIPRCLIALLAGFALTAWAVDLGTFSCDSLTQVKTLVSVDKNVKAGGEGAIKVEAAQGAMVTIADQKNLAIKKDNTLWCILKVKCSGVKQRAYFEMWCDVGNGQRAFSKGLDQPLQGDTDWREIHLPMMVNGDFLVNRALVNVVVEGPGTVWVDQIKFAKAKGLSAVYVPEG